MIRIWLFFVLAFLAGLYLLFAVIGSFVFMDLSLFSVYEWDTIGRASYCMCAVFGALIITSAVAVD